MKNSTITNQSAYNEGIADYCDDCYARNPYNENSEPAINWDLGFEDARVGYIRHMDEVRINKEIFAFEKWVMSGAPNGI